MSARRGRSTIVAGGAAFHRRMPAAVTVRPGAFAWKTSACRSKTPNCAEPVVLYRDVDGDGFGDPLEVTAGCSKTGFVDRGGDCDDAVASTYPEAPEQCNEVDDDCDGVVDDDPETLSWFSDLDGDGFGAQGPIVESCLQPEGTVSNALDCDDENDAVSPVAQETCNGLDENCSGMADDGPLMECAVGEVVECTTECGSMSTTVCGNECRIDTCPPPAESCNLVDDDCDGAIDNGVSSLVDLGSVALPFLSPSVEYVHTLKAVSTSNGIVVFVLVKGQSELPALRISAVRRRRGGARSGAVGDARVGLQDCRRGRSMSPWRGTWRTWRCRPTTEEPTFGQGPELVRVSLVDLREVDSVGDAVLARVRAVGVPLYRRDGNRGRLGSPLHRASMTRLRPKRSCSSTVRPSKRGKAIPSEV